MGSEVFNNDLGWSHPNGIVIDPNHALHFSPTLMPSLRNTRHTHSSMQYQGPGRNSYACLFMVQSRNRQNHSKSNTLFNSLLAVAFSSALNIGG